LSNNPTTASVQRRRQEKSGVDAVTISHIAKSAGTSVTTVFKVINGQSGVAADTRARVEVIVEQHGYRGPANRRNVLELVVPELDSMWIAAVIRDIGRAGRMHDVRVIVSWLDANGAALADVAARRPLCVVAVAGLAQSDRDRLTAKDIPLVVFDPATDLPDDVPFVGATNWTGGHAAAPHLAVLGHRRIAMISGPNGMVSCWARLEGYRAALQNAGLPTEPGLVEHAALTPEAGYAAAVRLLARADRPTGIVTAHDLQAVGVYLAARETGLSIPDDLSVVGFGDLPAVEFLDPPLTSVHQPLTQMTVAATELALALGRGDHTPHTRMEFATTVGSDLRRPSTTNWIPTAMDSWLSRGSTEPERFDPHIGGVEHEVQVVCPADRSQYVGGHRFVSHLADGDVASGSLS
jgi:DNA-binding LacI/PurR family transcriptional regulator